MKLPFDIPFKMPAIDKGNIVSALFGAGFMLLLFAGLTSFLLSIMPLLFGIAALVGLYLWLNKPTVGADDD